MHASLLLYIAIPSYITMLHKYKIIYMLNKINYFTVGEVLTKLFKVCALISVVFNLQSCYCKC